MGKLRYRNLVPAEGMSNMFVNIRLGNQPAGSEAHCRACG
ncbi:Uncharacterised protein [Escherichia coli]|uniref:Uncharacterized protein n=1 Tax=Escherichia coli TaxID=562 RepID=A0A376MUG2_ECOLX|nr:Uncharacterised protein [Escherichia coli]